MGPSPESNFVRIAEEQSRGAFQSIESVVNAVASVANMLSSTHNAVFSSFRAVIGVVEQFSLLKAQVGGFFFVTFVRWMRWIWRTLLVHLGLKPANYNNQEMIWTDIQTRSPTAAEFLPGQQTGFNWAAAIFWMIALGGPYLIYKAVSKMVANVEESRKWATGDREHYTAQALYDFNGSSTQELSFRKNDRLRVAPKAEQPQVRGWLLASSEDGQSVGLVPINYVKILARQSASPPTVPKNPLDENTSQSSSPIHSYPNRTSQNSYNAVKAAEELTGEVEFKLAKKLTGLLKKGLNGEMGEGLLDVVADEVGEDVVLDRGTGGIRKFLSKVGVNCLLFCGL
uniref:Peroxisomal membrane protein PEX13 n=1 Tax=Panagrolaimus sp. JU765 TaxID=591449 RepID=A0AC34RB22_9BILA